MCMGAADAAAYYATPGADDVKAPSITVAPDPVVDPDFVASGPSRVADLGAGSVRSVRTRRTSSPRTVPAPGAPSDVPEDPWPSRPVRIRCPPP